jgi:putative hydrolase of the HAD superfamily
VFLTPAAPYFFAAFKAHEVGVAKPDAKIFQAATRHLELDASQVLHVGDDAHLDIAAARAAGMQTLWINRTAKPWPFDTPSGPVASDLHGVIELLD